MRNNILEQNFRYVNYFYILIFYLLFISSTYSQTNTIQVGDAYSSSPVNTTIFRSNSLYSYNGFQYISFYDSSGYVIVGKRKLNKKEWILSNTGFKGLARDPHNTISFIIDLKGFLHISWDNHNNKLNYAVSVKPESLLFKRSLMTGLNEDQVSYPQFFKLISGDLLFTYRQGGSGDGNMIMNRYSLKSKNWTTLHKTLIDGQGLRNAYWQMFVSHKGTIHLSWVWRESSDVSSNHDLCYAKSYDSGKTWVNTKEIAVETPFTTLNSEYVSYIPQESDLINQTSITADKNDNPYIATYYRSTDDQVPQYYVFYHQGTDWRKSKVGNNQLVFNLSGKGSKRPPISRPLILSNQEKLYVIVRKGFEKIYCYENEIQLTEWNIKTLYSEEVGYWEPTHDPILLNKKNVLSLLIQKSNWSKDIHQSKIKVLNQKLKSD